MEEHLRSRENGIFRQSPRRRQKKPRGIINGFLKGPA